MNKRILITGATDGIGLETARLLVEQGHDLLLHGRNPDKLNRVDKELCAIPGGGSTESYVADLSRMADVEALAVAIAERHKSLDVLINNAGVFQASAPITPEGLDLRFVVNTLAPYLLTQRLLPLMNASGRVINVSSAAQSPVDSDALAGRIQLDDRQAYAQSKLAITMWSRSLALSLQGHGPSVIAVNPGSLLGSKMVKEAFGIDGGDIRIGADILVRAALTDEFATATGQYYDNDSRAFAPPHPDALDPKKLEEILRAIQAVLSDITP